MATVRCPICGRRFEFEESPARPFCGPRCRQIDLGRWLDERYSLPEPSPEEGDADEADSSAPASD